MSLYIILGQLQMYKDEAWTQVPIVYASLYNNRNIFIIYLTKIITSIVARCWLTIIQILIENIK